MRFGYHATMCNPAYYAELAKAAEAAGYDTFTVTATDSAGGTGSVTYDLLVDAALSVSTPTLPAANIGTVYSQKLAATGGTGIYTFTISQGSLPAGQTFSR